MSLQIATQAVVASIQDAGLRELICPAGSDLYNERIADYWSLAAQKKPFAIIHPKTTEHVSRILSIIVKVPDCLFAVRSGGHIAWVRRIGYLCMPRDLERVY